MRDLIKIEFKRVFINIKFGVVVLVCFFNSISSFFYNTRFYNCKKLVFVYEWK